MPFKNLNNPCASGAIEKILCEEYKVSNISFHHCPRIILWAFEICTYFLNNKTPATFG